MSLEALRTKFDSLAWEKGQLEVENRRLRESNPEQEAMVNLEAELNQSKEEIEQLTEQLGEIPRLVKQLRDALQREEGLRQWLQATEGQPAAT